MDAWNNYLRLICNLRRNSATDPSPEMIREIMPYEKPHAIQRLLTEARHADPGHVVCRFAGPPLRVQGAVHVFRLRKGFAMCAGTVRLDYVGVYRQRTSFACAPDSAVELNKDLIVGKRVLGCEGAQDAAAMSWPDQLVWDRAIRVLIGNLVQPQGRVPSIIQQFAAWVSEYQHPTIHVCNWRPPPHEELGYWITQYNWEPAIGEELARRPWASFSFCAICGGGIHSSRDTVYCEVCGNQFPTAACEHTPFPLPVKLFRALPCRLERGPATAWLKAYEKWLKVHTPTGIVADQTLSMSDRQSRVIDLSGPFPGDNDAD